MDPVLGAIKLELERFGVMVHAPCHNHGLFYANSLASDEFVIVLGNGYIRVCRCGIRVVPAVDDVKMCDPNLVEVILGRLGYAA